MQTLRPGLLVSLKTSASGNVSYNRTELAPETIEGGVARSKWETERTIADAKEHEAALRVQAKAGALIRTICARSAFGLLCAEDKLDKLEAAITEARKMAADFNATARLSRVSVDVLMGRIAPDEAFAVRAINSEVSALMRDMENGLAKLDVKAVREAADKAREVSAMLSDQAQARVSIAVDTARSAARQIVKAEKDGKAAEIDKLAVVKISEMRAGFLDMDDAGEVQTPEARERALDLGYGVQAAG